MDKTEIQLNASATLTVETNVELKKVAHLGPVLCTSDASTTKAIVKIGTQEIDGTITREKLRAELQASLIPGFSAKINGEKFTEIEKRLIKTQENSIENTWVLKSKRCKKISHEIYQHFEDTTYTISKRRFLADVKSVYRCRHALPFFDIEQTCESYKDPACDGCDGRQSSDLLKFQKTERPTVENDFSGKYLPFRFFIVGEQEPGGCVTFTTRIELLSMYGDPTYLFVTISVLNIAFLLPLPREWGLIFRIGNKPTKAVESLIQKLSGLSMEEIMPIAAMGTIPILQCSEIEGMLARANDLDGVDYQLIGSLEWAEDFSDDDKFVAIDTDRGVILNINYIFLTQTLLRPQSDFIRNVVGLDKRVTCGFMLNNIQIFTSSDISFSARSRKRRDGGMLVG